MKMHLINILNTLNVNDYEKKELVNHFKNNIVSYSATEKALINLRRNEL
jgi:hydroxymethylglutaryl-CoA reductase